MSGIIDYLTVVIHFLYRFAESFSRPHPRDFALCLSTLMVYERGNFKRISNGSVADREHSNKERLMSRSLRWEEKADEHRLELIKESVGALNTTEAYLVIDDTLVEQAGLPMDEVRTRYGHATHRYMLADSVLSSQWVTPRGSFRIGSRLYFKQSRCGACFKTKIQMARELIAQALDAGFWFHTVVLDAWLLSRELARFIESERLGWVSSARSNRIMYLAGKRMSLQTFRATLQPLDFSKKEVNGRAFHCFTKTVRMAKLGKVRVVIAHERADLSDAPAYLLTNNRHWEELRTLRAYQSRWPIQPLC